MKQETGIILLLVGIIIGFAAGMITTTAMKPAAIPSVKIVQQPTGEGELPPSTGVVPGSFEADQQAAEKARLNEKIKQLKYALEKDPQNMDILVQLGNNYFDTDQHYASIDSYKKALEINPDMPNVLVDLGIMYRRTDKIDLALEMFNKAIEVDPKHSFAHSNRGIVYKYDLKEYQKAIDNFKKFIELAPPGNPMIERAEAEIADAQELIKQEGSAGK